jgi:ABC-type siderophore export system fused ATPase/permease subunit
MAPRERSVPVSPPVTVAIFVAIFVASNVQPSFRVISVFIGITTLALHSHTISRIIVGTFGTSFVAPVLVPITSLISMRLFPPVDVSGLT